MGKLLDDAIIYAVQKHGVRVRRGSKLPFIVHPAEAVAIASYMTDDDEILAAAALHDVIDKADVTKEELTKRFGERVAHLAAYFAPEKKEQEEGQDWKALKQKDIEKLSAAGREEKMIFLSDRLANIRSTRRKYETEGRNVFQGFHMSDFELNGWYYKTSVFCLKELEQEYAYKEYSRLIDEIFGRE